jgi:phage terminase small subunit
VIDEQAAVVLGVALQAYDRMQQARIMIKKEGLIVTSARSGVRHAHPAIGIEATARQQFLAAWRNLGFDVVPPGEMGRPPGRRGEECRQ